MPSKMYEYERAKSLSRYVVDAGMLPFKILISSTKITVKGMQAVLGKFFRKEGIDDVGISTDPDGDGVWLWRRK